jgi:hypothetical protein
MRIHVKLLIFVTMLMVSLAAYSSEAMRFAKHGCEVKKNQTACKLYEKLKNYHANKGSQEEHYSTSGSSTVTENEDSYTFESETQSGGLTIKSSVTMDKKTVNQMQADCGGFGQSLISCSPFSCRFNHPFGGKMERKIVGEENGKCKTEEEMPNNGLMTCYFDDSTKSLAADFYDSMGKKNQSKMNQWMSDGTCEISGY